MAETTTTGIIRRVQESFDRLSPASNVALAVLEYVNRDDVGAADVALVASADPVLTAKIMRMANSAFYGMGGKISQLNVAISMLGLITVRSIAVSTVMDKVGGLYEVDWVHAIETAIASSILASRFGANPGAAFSVGMLHDLGNSLFRDYDSLGLEDIASISATGLTPESESEVARAELEVYGITHPALGAYILDSWNFPTEVISAIALHHAQENSPAPLLRTLRSADRLAHLSHTSDFGEGLLMPEVEKEEVPILLEQLMAKSSEVLGLFG